MEERKGLFRWIREHKKQLIAVGVSIMALLTTIWGIKHRSELKALWDDLKALVNAPTEGNPNNIPENTKAVTKSIPTEAKVATQGVEIKSETFLETAVETIADDNFDPIGELPEAITLKTFSVQEHLRNLPEGWHPSTEKIEEALAKGITLLDNQTLVDTYRKGVVA